MSDPAAKAGSWPYKVHDRRGGVYEYRIYIQGAQASRDSVMARRDALWSNQERAHAARAQRTMLGRFIHFNGMCVCIRGDVVSAGGFEGSDLYVEFSLRYSRSLWRLRGPKWLIEKMKDTGDVFGDEDTAHVRSTPCWTSSCDICCSSVNSRISLSLFKHYIRLPHRGTCAELNTFQLVAAVAHSHECAG